ncbi:MAG: T9SS type A sorting domain-containing protein, partial [Candidatus Krumholzibacteria bacterium]|nr:T9SS type A sorting domain-containing protein [Candidatus Krumholzibacteria bacterium]
PGDMPVVRYDGKIFVRSGPDLAEGVFPPGTWELVTSVPAVQQDAYIARVPTTADSSDTGSHHSIYIVTAHTTTPSIWYVGLPDSGFSIDNIAPAVPGSFALAYNTGAGNHLSWDVCPDEDFQYFRVYRSTDPGFVPSQSTLVHSSTGTDWNDPDYDGWAVYYKVTALDYTGNESDPTSAGTATGITERVTPKHISLAQNVPNPFNPSTTISIGLPSAASVTLSVYDVNGRRVASLVDGPVPAGFRSFTWQGRDNNGHRVSSGVYFYRLELPGVVDTRKMVLLK